MKPVFKCDYCNFMGTEEEVRAHEFQCAENYDKRNCLTCTHKDGIKKTKDGWAYQCNEGINIPANHIFEHCYKYEKKEKPNSVFDFIDPLDWLK